MDMSNGFDAVKFLNTHFAANRFPTLRKLLAAGGWIWVYFRIDGTIGAYTCKFQSVFPAQTEFHKSVIDKLEEELLTEIHEFEIESAEIFKKYKKGAAYGYCNKW